ncbi:MAG TPA: alpha-glucan family phosphorylase [Mycobacteriales bacterium]|nr:alpha-glucan family phosphorylase [Mycobacteriales bacterium]
MRALRRFVVRATLPPELSALDELVMNLRWSWHPPSLDVLEAVDPQLWAASNGDPVRMLGAVSAERLADLAADPEFCARLGAAERDLQAYLRDDRWYQQLPDAPDSIAYFSPEFGIAAVLPQYSGGLGILAGDHLKAASDLGVPIIGVGLLYREGYFAQSLSRDGWQLEDYPSQDPHGLPLSLLHDADGTQLRVSVPLADGRSVTAQVWKAQVGRVPLLLLDSDIEENEFAERQITDKLYGGNVDHRLQQEMLLGIGGVRALRAYCGITGNPAPTVFHTNEGHAGFLGVERIRELSQDGGLSFDEALQATRAGTVFTTHTPVPAGIDRFTKELIGRYFANFDGIPVERIIELGEEDDPALFNMAHMGFRLAQRANGVSRLHGRVSREMFGNLWPGFEPDEVPIRSITNGVHDATWMGREMSDLLASRVDELPAEQVWSVRRAMRGRLVAEIRRRLRASSRQRGMTDAELAWTDSAFDPDVLTIGFARRVPTYKRLTLILRDPDRLRALLLNSERPVQLVVAGKSHPHDDTGKALIQQMVQFADDPAVRGRIAFLPGYDIGMAKYLYWGCDIWLNNPLRPLEACGTSGMKAALNGGLNLSIRDGWWDEMFDGANGWAIPTADGVDDPGRRDDLEAAALYELIETQVAPRFYDRDSGGVPRRWVEMVTHTLGSLGPQVPAARMVREYVEQLYLPAAATSARLGADDFRPARELAAWRSKVLQQWPAVRVQHVESSGVGDTPALGALLHLRAEVDLAGLDPADVEVQAVAGRVDESGGLHEPESTAMTFARNGEGMDHFEADVPLGRTGPFGYTVRVFPRHELLATPADLGVVRTA